jgi:hypothetical protein
VEKAKENEALLTGSGMSVAGWHGSMEMTPKRFCTAAEKNVQLHFNFTIAKKCPVAISFHNCKILCRNNTKKFTFAISVHNCKKIAQLQTKAQLQKMYNCKTNLYCNTKAEALTSAKPHSKLMLHSILELLFFSTNLSNMTHNATPALSKL